MFPENFKLFDWIRFVVQVIMIPFAVYTVNKLQVLETGQALIQQRMDLRTIARDQQFSDMLAAIKDHEGRIRHLEDVR